MRGNENIKGVSVSNGSELAVRDNETVHISGGVTVEYGMLRAGNNAAICIEDSVLIITNGIAGFGFRLSGRGQLVVRNHIAIGPHSQIHAEHIEIYLGRARMALSCS